jgi:hypothetical protein
LKRGLTGGPHLSAGGREREVRWAGGVFVGRKKSGRERESKSEPEACCGCGLKEKKKGRWTGLKEERKKRDRVGKLEGFFRLELLIFLKKTTTRIQTKQMQRNECIQHLLF